MDTLPPDALFTLCQAGAEKTLKAEISRTHPSFRFAYSRPGFVTFKTGPLRGDFELKSVFVRAYGISLGKLKPDPSGLPLAEILLAAKTLGTPPPRLHLSAREDSSELDAETAARIAVRSEAARQKILESGLFLPDPTPAAGDLVYDVICVDENEWWHGMHRHGGDHSPFAGGKPPLNLHPQAPSRAYLKLEEALLWSRAPLRRGDVAVEIGSAPGGASFALLERGLRVIGIDPADMDPRVLAHPDFRHIARPVAEVPREELPARVDWLLLDMNVAPSVSLFAMDRLASRTRDSLLGLILTIKLNRWEIAAEIPGMLEHVRAIGQDVGITRIRAKQLFTNRQEICIAALTRKGAQRLAQSTPG